MTEDANITYRPKYGSSKSNVFVTDEFSNYEVASKIFGTTLITGNILNRGSREVAEHQENTSNMYRFHYLKAEMIINKKVHFKKNRKIQITQLQLK